MQFRKNEQGYALLLVLFLVVFIMAISAVFMRGALSNAKQGKTVDQNNLSVVAAEMGVEYYTTLFTNEFLSVKAKSEEKVTNDNALLIENEEPGYTAEEFLSEVKREVLVQFESEVRKVNEKMEEYYPSGVHFEKPGNDNFEFTVIGPNDDIEITGDIIGRYPSDNAKESTLSLHLAFLMPQQKEEDDSGGSTPVDPEGSLITMPTLREPKQPANPVAIVGISKQPTKCGSSSTEIENQKCNATGISEASYAINKSSVFIDNNLNSWGTVRLENSFVNIGSNFTSKNIKLEDTVLVVNKDITANGGSTTISKSKVQVGNFSSSGQDSIATLNEVQMNLTGKLLIQVADIKNSTLSMNEFYIHSSNNKFNKTDLKVTTKYTSGGVKFENSRLDIGGTFTTNGEPEFYIENSDVKIAGDASMTKGSIIKKSSVSINGKYTNSHKPLHAEDSDIFIGKDVSATNGTNLEDVNMIVLEGYKSSMLFKLDDTKLSIGGLLNLGNGGEMEDSLLIAKKITTDNTLKLDDSVLYADELDLKNGIMTMEDSNVCVKVLNVRSLKMDDDSKIYYSNTSNHTKNNIIKLSSEEFDKKCGMKSSDVTEDQIGSGDFIWGSPKVDVEYN